MRRPSWRRGCRPDDAVFADPARRNERGRVWRVADFTPDLDLLTALMDGSRPVGIKLGPALPHALVPAQVEAEWISHRGDVVEAALWAGSGAYPRRWSALVWPDARLVAEPGGAALSTAGPRAYLYEPDGAVLRAGALPVLGRALEATLMQPQIAYLSGDRAVLTPFATRFLIRQVLPYDLKGLRRWIRDHGVGVLEIKKRGFDVDPAALRRQLRPIGPRSATIVLCRVAQERTVLVVERER